MTTAKIVSMKARPLQASHLCFGASGILEEMNISLGEAVSAYDRRTQIEPLLGETVPGSPGQLKYNSSIIYGAMHPDCLMALRAEPLGAALDTAITARWNAWLSKYSQIAEIAVQASTAYGSGPLAKPARLAALANISQNQHDALAAAYYDATSRPPDLYGNPAQMQRDYGGTPA